MQEFKRGGIQERRDTGKEGCRKGGMQETRDSEQKNVKN